MSEEYVTVVLNHQKIVHGDHYPNKWTILHIGSFYRCPVDEAYTMVKTGKALYPDGVEILRKMLYKNITLEERVQKLEAQSVLFDKLNPIINTAISIYKKVKTFIEAHKFLVGISSLLVAGYAVAKKLHWF